MMNCYPLTHYLKELYGETYISDTLIEKVSDFTRLDDVLVEKALYWYFYKDNHLDVVQYIAECYNFPLDELFLWDPAKGSQKIYIRWKKKMERRWDRYKRYWIEKSRTCKKQNYDLDFKLKVLKEYKESDLTLREIAQKYEISKDKIKVWSFLYAQV